MYFYIFFFFSSRRRHTRFALVTGVQTCALPIFTSSRLHLHLPGVVGGSRTKVGDLDLVPGGPSRLAAHVKNVVVLKVAVDHLRTTQGPSISVAPLAEIGRASCRERVCHYV